jgi:phage N-6-adenine-methyltransferase
LSLNALGGAINGGGWATAACVWAWTEPRPRGGQLLNGEKSPFSVSDFAALRIRGLTTRNAVRAYRSAWDRAITRGWASPVEPGAVVSLPTQDFRETEALPGQNTGNSEWFTPGEYIAAARDVMGGIDLDPASTPEANEVVQADTFYTAADDGLAQNWHGTVWMNPPYASALIEKFCAKLATEYRSGTVTAACALTNNATETAWFHTLAGAARCLCFPQGRVQFWHPDKDQAAPLQGQTVTYLGRDREHFVSAFSSFGLIVSMVDG